MSLMSRSALPSESLIFSARRRALSSGRVSCVHICPKHHY
jgi:hypothetical protein